MIQVYYFVLLCSCFGSSEPYKQFPCRYTENPVIIDAELDEWKNAAFIQIADEMGKSDNAVLIYSLWDDENLYIAFDVTDTDLRAKQTEQDHAELYLDDMVEFLIDSRNDKDSCWNIDDIIYHINILGQKKDDQGTTTCLTNPVWNGDAEYSILVNGSINDPTHSDEGYVVEIRIPWRDMKIEPFTGQLIGVNFGNGDNGKLFDWVDASPFRSPYAFGNLILSGKK